MENKIKNLRKNLNEDDLLKQQSEFLKELKDPNFQPTYSKLYKSETINEKNKLNKEQEKLSSIENVFMPLNIIEYYSSSFSSNIEIKNIEKNFNDLELGKL